MAHHDNTVRKLIAAVTAAGGQTDVTGKGHLRVRGPAGVAIIGSDYKGNPVYLRAALGSIRRYAGLTVTL